MERSKTLQYIQHAIRIFTGILFLPISASKFGIIQSPVSDPIHFTTEGWAFMLAIESTGYLDPAIGVFGLLCAIAFLSNRYVALAAIVLVPITLNFVLFHIFLGFEITSFYLLLRESSAFFVFALNLAIVYGEREKYAALLQP